MGKVGGCSGPVDNEGGGGCISWLVFGRFTPSSGPFWGQAGKGRGALWQKLPVLPTGRTTPQRLCPKADNGCMHPSSMGNLQQAGEFWRKKWPLKNSEGWQ